LNSFLACRGGGIKFEQKALNCELGGGIAAVIYNNVRGLISGGLADPTAVGIPAIEITQSAGQSLLSQSMGEILIVKEEIGYSYSSGTSMAAPHVAGVAGKIWRAVSLLKPRAIFRMRRDRTEDILFYSQFPLSFAPVPNV